MKVRGWQCPCQCPHTGVEERGTLLQISGCEQTSLMLLSEPLLLNNTHQRQQQAAHPLLLSQSKLEKTMTFANVIE